MKSKRIGVSVSVLAFALCGTTLAHAQAAQGAGPQPGAAEAQQGVGEIVVTAQKRSESAQRIPVSVEAIAGETLVRSGVKDLFQVADLVPGVVFSRAPDDGLALTFRGLGTTARPQAFEQSRQRVIV